MSKESDEVRRNLEKQLRLNLDIVKLRLTKEEQSIFRIDSYTSTVTPIKIYLASATSKRLRKRPSKHTEYFFGISKKALSVFLRTLGSSSGGINIYFRQSKFRGYILLACGYSRGMPEYLYLIPADFFEAEDHVNLMERAGEDKIHLKIFDNGCQRINEYKKDIRQYLISLSDITNLADKASRAAIGSNVTKARTDIDIERTYGPFRDSAKAKRLKSLYGFRCQICGGIYIGNSRHYAEVHHIWPLGHGGPDEKSNMIIVCPNHHAEFEYGCLKIIADGAGYRISHIDSGNEFDGLSICIKANHNINTANLHYHELNIWQKGID